MYDILPHSPGFRWVGFYFIIPLVGVVQVLIWLPIYSFASKLYNVPQEEIRLDESPKVVKILFSSLHQTFCNTPLTLVLLLLQAVVHPALLLYFDGFDGTHHVASEALAARYPTDVSGKPEDADVVVSTPSIMQLQSADEDKLLTYLRCDDSTIVQFVMASLEGMWLGECGQSVQDEVQRAVELAGQKKWDEAREMLEQVVHDFPEYAYAWNKLAMVEYQSGMFLLYYDRINARAESSNLYSVRV